MHAKYCNFLMTVFWGKKKNRITKKLTPLRVHINNKTHHQNFKISKFEWKKNAILKYKVLPKLCAVR